MRAKLFCCIISDRGITPVGMLSRLGGGSLHRQTLYIHNAGLLTFHFITSWRNVQYLTHTHTHTFNGPLSGTTQVSRYQTGITNLDFTGARDSEWQWHQLGHMQVRTSLQTDNHASTSLLFNTSIIIKFKHDKVWKEDKTKMFSNITLQSNFTARRRETRRP